MKMIPKQLARTGIFYLEEAVLDVISQGEGDYVRNVDIARITATYDRWRQSDWLVPAIVFKLEADGRIEAKRTERGSVQGWKLTESEENRRADIDV